jgi:hypothetical protein
MKLLSLFQLTANEISAKFERLLTVVLAEIKTRAHGMSAENFVDLQGYAAGQIDGQNEIITAINGIAVSTTDARNALGNIYTSDERFKREQKLIDQALAKIQKIEDDIDGFKTPMKGLTDQLTYQPYATANPVVDHLERTRIQDFLISRGGGSGSDQKNQGEIFEKYFSAACRTPENIESRKIMGAVITATGSLQPILDQSWINKGLDLYFRFAAPMPYFQREILRLRVDAFNLLLIRGRSKLAELRTPERDKHLERVGV